MRQLIGLLLFSALLCVQLRAAEALAEAELSEELRYWYPVPAANPPKTYEADVIVYGASPAGVTAAIQCKRMGKTVVLAEFGKHVGGLTSGGLSATDVGNRNAIAGMANEFYAKVGMLRGFKPSAAELAFRDMLKEAKVETVFEQRVKEVEKNENLITQITMENGNVYKGRVFIDATYEGDLMALAKVSYTFGREANAQYNETINGAQFHAGHNFVKPIDPYVVEGDPKSGLLPRISAAVPPKPGAGDKLIQAYNYRMFLTNQADSGVPFPKPKNYDPKQYELLARYLKEAPRPPVQLHNGDCNNEGAFSSDDIGMNYEWPDASYPAREKIFQEHVRYQAGFMYFIGHDESVPETVRAEVQKWRLASSEFTGSANWPHQMYIREARRMVSDYVMTENVCSGKITVDDSIGLGAYNMDSHNCERIVVNGKVRNEGDVQIAPRHPYGISYRSIVPKEIECRNLLVPVALSCTHIAYGSIRMEPVFMILGQSAGTAACLALHENIAVQSVAYERLKTRLLADKQKLVWDGPMGTDVKAQKHGGIAVKELKGIVLDDTQAERKGEWTETTARGGYIGDGYIHDGNSGKGEKSARFNADVTADGTYEIRSAHTALPNRASNVPCTISVNGEKKSEVKINQRNEPVLEHGFILLAKLALKAGDKLSIEFSNAGTDGHVIVDAVQIINETELKK